MKSYGLVIDESLQPPHPYLLLPTSSPVPIPTRPHLDATTQSYSTVVQQAIITKDRPLLKEIIAEADHKTRRNTLAAMANEKVPPLLGLLEEFLYEDSRNTDHYCAWLKDLIRQHLGLILSAPDNRPVVARLLKYIEKRSQERSILLRLRAALQAHTQSSLTKGKEFKPKFTYIENQEKEGEEEDLPPMEEDFDLEDDMLDELDD